ncbi:SEC-C metal-binding domain-containing protein [Vibrio splendidus]|uniref:SEC-C metal-binding domain-containing protein n=1 Tax=Vibrio splendidus TaxID=29497 RepID=UPI000D3A17A4|nr:SEC-C metal-binding domain-containing protein [Vibrio splendidus]PTO54672.1 SecA-like protein [Vibrio splendidus]
MSLKESPERVAFLKLEELCGRDGFIHVLSYLSRRDCTFGYQGGVTGENLGHFYSPDRLIRTELSVLHGLIQKSGITTVNISDEEIRDWSREAEEILEEIHEVLKDSGYQRFTKENMKLGMEDFFSHEDIIREYVFYSAEQAFDFQFAELARERYQNDSVWMLENVGFDLNEAYSIYKSIMSQLNENMTALAQGGERGAVFKSYLSCNELNLGSLCELTGFPESKVIAFLDAFSPTPEDDNSTYNLIDDVNIVNFKPITKAGSNYYLFQTTALSQSMYESPIFWMRSDKKYINTAVKHRGEFTESFAFKRLKNIFGEENVYCNLDIYKNASEKIGEVDILAKFGTKFLIVQAKSKGMTIPARQGKIGLVKDDFVKGVQNAYDQAVECSNALLLEEIIIKDIDGNCIDLGSKPSSCYPICLTSESYPGLLFQCRQYLKHQEEELLKPPFVMDVFFLDILTEFLKQPLFLLSYIDRRSGYLNEMVASTEIVLLGLHLKRNLWLENNFTMMSLHDDIASDLDAAFMVRRMELSGSRTPDGILKRYSEGFISKLLFKLQHVKRDELTDFAFILMKSSGDFLDTLDAAVTKICFETIQDNRSHDFTVLFENESGGMTIHTSAGSREKGREALLSHMHARKYKAKQDVWLGVVVDPRSEMVMEICHIEEDWCFNAEMEDAIKSLNLKPDVSPCLKTMKKQLKFKVSRNDKCPCGSNKKYKRCCGA